MRKPIFTILAIASLSVSCYAGIFNDIGKTIDRSTKQISKNIENKAEKVVLIEDVTKVKQIAASTLKETQDAYDQLLEKVIEDAQKLEEQRATLQNEKLLLEKSKAKLVDDKAELEKDKSDLKFQKNVFSTGFFASIGTIFIGAMTIVMRRPIVKAEFQLKELEIEEKQLKLKEMKKLIEAG